jgi:putative aminopeptidase FrvX
MSADAALFRRDAFLETLGELCEAHSPSGCEREIDRVLVKRLEASGILVWQDQVGNVIGHVRGRRTDRPLRLTAHKDEIGLIVKRVEDDGRLRVQRLGGMYLFKFGEGPVDILGDDAVVPGVLSFGSVHASEESALDSAKLGRTALKWSDVHVDCKLTARQIAQAGVHVGTKVTLARSLKRPRVLSDYVCSYSLDDKCGVALLLLLADALHKEPPPQDVYLVFSSGEEISGGGASFAARSLPGDALVGLEIAPVADEYGIVNDARPVIIYADTRNVYDEAICVRAAQLASTINIGVQRAVISSYVSDPGTARQTGSAARVGLFAFPAENTHGYEVAHLGGVANLLHLVEAFCRAWGDTNQP